MKMKNIIPMLGLALATVLGTVTESSGQTAPKKDTKKKTEINYGGIQNPVEPKKDATKTTVKTADGKKVEEKKPEEKKVDAKKPVPIWTQVKLAFEDEHPGAEYNDIDYDVRDATYENFLRVGQYESKGKQADTLTVFYHSRSNVVNPSDKLADGQSIDSARGAIQSTVIIKNKGDKGYNIENKISSGFIFYSQDYFQVGKVNDPTLVSYMYDFKNPSVTVQTNMVRFFTDGAERIESDSTYTQDGGDKMDKKDVTKKFKAMQKLFDKEIAEPSLGNSSDNPANNRGYDGLDSFMWKIVEAANEGKSITGLKFAELPPLKPTTGLKK